MIRRFYVHNYRCLENFEWLLAGHPSSLLIGKNGAGKSTIGFALEILQKIARGENRVKFLLEPKDIAHGRAELPVRFEMEVELDGKSYEYRIAFELPAGFKELRILEERLVADGHEKFAREKAELRVAKEGTEAEARFSMDWHLVALPIVHDRAEKDPVQVFKRWLARMLILRPVPWHIDGDSSEETLQPDDEVRNFGDWFTGMVRLAPAAYVTIDRYLRQIMPDLKDIQNPEVAPNVRRLAVRFSSGDRDATIAFRDLSDGEKCFLIWALTLAANEINGPLFCFWDEPDNYVGLSEVWHFIMHLRKEFEKGGQFVATSHNAETIRAFSAENTFVVHRRNHMEPALIRSLSSLKYSGDLIGALVRDDVEL